MIAIQHFDLHPECNFQYKFQTLSYFINRFHEGTLIAYSFYNRLKSSVYIDRYSLYISCAVYMYSLYSLPYIPIKISEELTSI